MIRGSLLLAAAAVSACQSSGERSASQVFAEDSVSFAPPAGWQVRRERETLVLVGGSPTDRERPVVALRTVSTEGWSEPRTLESVLPDTAAVLRALPGAVVSGPFDVEHPVYRAQAFDVSWTPRSKDGRRYQRRHVTIEAHQHIYHLFLTAAEGQLAAGRAELDRVLETLREEG